MRHSAADPTPRRVISDLCTGSRQVGSQQLLTADVRTRQHAALGASQHMIGFASLGVCPSVLCAVLTQKRRGAEVSVGSLGSESETAPTVEVKFSP